MLHNSFCGTGHGSKGKENQGKINLLLSYKGWTSAFDRKLKKREQNAVLIFWDGSISGVRGVRSHTQKNHTEDYTEFCHKDVCRIPKTLPFIQWFLYIIQIKIDLDLSE